MSSTHKKDFEKCREDFLQALDHAAGYKATTTKGFLRLSIDVKLRTDQPVSASTLKRLYGYVGGLGTPRRRTLNILAQFMGYPDFETYIQATHSAGGAESGFVSSKILYTKDLAHNAVIRLFWHPKHVCICQYKGDDTFVVTRSEKTRMVVNTTFRCPVFIAGEILFLHLVSFPDSNVTCTYKVGIKYGIQFEVL